MKGVLFTPDNIKATVEGRKTQTRRVVTIPKWLALYEPHLDEAWADRGELGAYLHIPCYKHLIHDNVWGDCRTVQRHYPRYDIGEIVYIKEAWATYRANDDWTIPMIPDTATIFYKLDGDKYGHTGHIGKWRSPLFLKEIFARYFIKITDVRAENLGVITEEDAIKEGVNIKAVHTKGNLVISEPSYITSFSMLWDSINKDYTYDSSPWVFVYSYKLVEDK